MIDKKYNIDIVLLRAFAVLVVIGYHFFPSYVPWGFVGVDIFFVLSGYLMVNIWCTGSTIFNFYLNRVRRIYPALLIVILVFSIVGFFSLLDDEFDSLINSSIAALLQVQNIREYLNGGYFTDAVNFRPMLHTWSLSMEFQFYFVLPVIFIASKFFKIGRISAVVIVTCLSIVACLLITEIYHFDAYFITPLRIWEFLAGGLCYLLMETIAINRIKWQLFLIASLVLFVLTIIFVRSGTEYPGFVAVFPVFASVCYLLAKQSCRLPSAVISVFYYISSISFSLYLFHFPVIEILKQIYGVPTISQRFLTLILIFLAAHFTDRQIVPKFLRFRRSTQALFLFSIISIILLVSIKEILPASNRAIMKANSNEISTNTFKLDYKDNCKFLGITEHKDDRCRSKVANINHPNLVIVGDSLSNSLTTVFDELSTDFPQYNDYIQIGRGLCPGVIGVGSDDCVVFTEVAIKFIENLDPKIPVFLAGQWPLYYHPENPAELDKLRVGLDTTLTRLSANNRKVVFVYNVPLGALPRTCVSRHPLSSVGQCDIPKEVADQRDGGYRQFIEELLGKYDVVKFDPKKLMCDELSCVVYYDNHILYLDDSHLSRQGGSELAKRAYSWFLNNSFVDAK